MYDEEKKFHEKALLRYGRVDHRIDGSRRLWFRCNSNARRH
jgi:hypothetical protein